MRRMFGQRAKGFTLMELTVVSGLAIGLAMMTAQMWRYFTVQAADLSQRCDAAQELKLAMQSVANDMGSVVTATPTASNGLRITCLALGGQSNVTVEYWLSGQLLKRKDVATGVSVTIATKVSGFTATDVTSSLLRVTIYTTAGTITRQATLYWSRP